METPILNIESIGCKDIYHGTNIVSVRYIPSLTYTKRTLFGSSEQIIYIPIIFNSEEQIKDLFKYYDNVKFKIIFKEYLVERQTKSYNLLEIVNLEKICNKYNKYREFSINFMINYKGRDIELHTNRMGLTYSIESKYSDNIFVLIKHKDDIINKIQNNYTIFPMFMHYSFWDKRTGRIETYNSIEGTMEYIDEIDFEEKAVNDRLGSYYTKKSFKLVET